MHSLMMILPVRSIALTGQVRSHSRHGLPHSWRRFNIVNTCSRSRTASVPPSGHRYWQ